MAITVEDGTGVSNAVSYVTVAAADTYHTARGNSVWVDAVESDKEIALIRATDYVDQNRFAGEKLQDTQALQFPRYSIYDRNNVDVGSTVPTEIERATFEYALAVLGTGDALVELDSTPDQASKAGLTFERTKVGPVEEELRYDSGAGLRLKQFYPRADNLIKKSGFLLVSNPGSTVMR